MLFGVEEKEAKTMSPEWETTWKSQRNGGE